MKFFQFKALPHTFSSFLSVLTVVFLRCCDELKIIQLLKINLLYNMEQKHALRVLLIQTLLLAEAHLCNWLCKYVLWFYRDRTEMSYCKPFIFLLHFKSSVLKYILPQWAQETALHKRCVKWSVLSQPNFKMKSSLKFCIKTRIWKKVCLATWCTLHLILFHIWPYLINII